MQKKTKITTLRDFCVQAIITWPSTEQKDHYELLVMLYSFFLSSH